MSARDSKAPIPPIPPHQKQLKPLETDNTIIKSILSSLWQNFLLFLPQVAIDQEGNKLIDFLLPHFFRKK